MIRYYGLFLEKEGRPVGIARADDNMRVELLNLENYTWEEIKNLGKYEKEGKLTDLILEDTIAVKILLKLNREKKSRILAVGLN